MIDRDGRYVEVGVADARRLRDLIVEHMRAEPGFTNTRLQERAGVSQPTIADLLAAKPKRYRRDILSKVSHGLGWTPGSIEAVVAGGDPTLDGAGTKAAHADAELTERVSRLEARFDEVDQRIDRVLRALEERER